MPDVWSHPQLRARERWIEVATPAGPVPGAAAAGRAAAVAPRMDPVPALGEHTDAILRELGYARTDIAALREAARRLRSTHAMNHRPTERSRPSPRELRFDEHSRAGACAAPRT